MEQGSASVSVAGNGISDGTTGGAASNVGSAVAGTKSGLRDRRLGYNHIVRRWYQKVVGSSVENVVRIRQSLYGTSVRD